MYNTFKQRQRFCQQVHHDNNIQWSIYKERKEQYKNRNSIRLTKIKYQINWVENKRAIKRSVVQKDNRMLKIVLRACRPKTWPELKPI